MNFERRRPLRTPAERVGMLPNADMPPPQAAEETLLARALIDEDDRALRSVIDRMSPTMLRVARTYVRTDDEAQEVLQETWTAAVTAVRRFRGRASLRTWLFRILRNRARTRGKRAARFIPFSQLSSGETEGAGDPWLLAEQGAANHSPTLDPEQQVLAGELGLQIHRALQQLPERQREVVFLRDVEGRSSDEACAALGLSPENQRVLLHRGRSSVRSALKEYLVSGIVEGEARKIA